MGENGKPAEWPSLHCSPDPNYDFGQQKVRDHFVANVALPMAAGPNVGGLWFDYTDWLSCMDMCNEVHGLHLSPCDMAAKERLLNGTVAWKTAVAQQLNSRGQIPILSSINSWNGATPPQGSCFRDERQVTDEMAGLAYGRAYDGRGGNYAAIARAQAEAEARIAVFVNDYSMWNSTRSRPS